MNEGLYDAINSFLKVSERRVFVCKVSPRLFLGVVPSLWSIHPPHGRVDRIRHLIVR